ncbi:hypothetical protein [Amycolatopsis sp. NPDC051071]|uniref:hypothetical protein n=1 Tax=Amycolatopsis sp. NPDC051071 TaxID=3154637 RepID=UPI00343CBB7C
MRFISNIVEDSKDLLDDYLDTARDVEEDLRYTARSSLDYDNDERGGNRDRYRDDYNRGRYRDRDRDHDEGSLADLKVLQGTMASLAKRLDELVSLQQQQLEQPAEHKNPASASK